MKNNQTTAQRVRSVLLEKGIPYGEFVERDGIHLNTVRGAENRGTELSLDVILKILNAYPEWDRSYILFGESKEDKIKQAYHDIESILDDLRDVVNTINDVISKINIAKNVDL